MKLTRVTITGADDGVSHRALADLAQEFPWLELGVLYSLNQQGAPRYPSDGWRQELFRFIEPRQIALHFCGSAARSALDGIVEGLPYVPDGCRLQLNGFSNWRLPAGGVNEFNVESAIQLVRDLPGQDGWIDLETGCRDHENRFDLAKARRILELAKPFVEAA